jgi:hypothetical protein
VSTLVKLDGQRAFVLESVIAWDWIAADHGFTLRIHLMGGSTLLVPRTERPGANEVYAKLAEHFGSTQRIGSDCPATVPLFRWKWMSPSGALTVQRDADGTTLFVIAGLPQSGVRLQSVPARELGAYLTRGDG